MRRLMVRKWKYGEWRKMHADRELIELAKTQTLETIAARLGRSTSSILKKAAQLGLSIRRPKAKGK